LISFANAGNFQVPAIRVSWSKIPKPTLINWDEIRRERRQGGSCNAVLNWETYILQLSQLKSSEFGSYLEYKKCAAC
jgi:hypothetical protein